MKKTSSILASLVAIASIALLSCSSVDNPISSAEGVDYPQASTLSKAVSPESYAAAVSGSSKIISGSSWSIAGVPVGATQCSNDLYFLVSTPPTSSTVSGTGLTFCPGSSGTIAGAFAINSLTIRCVPPSPPNNTTAITWTGSGCVSTSYFNGQPAKGMECYVKFCGTCVGGYTVAGQYVSQCNRSFSGGNLTSNYTY